MRIIFLATLLFAFVLASNAGWNGCSRNFNCPRGTHCEEVGDYQVCVNDSDFQIPSFSICNSTDCPRGYECEKISSSIVTCEPKDNACKFFRCPIGTYCLSKFGLPTCIPINEFPNLCLYTGCPNNFDCKIVRGQPTCIRSGLLQPIQCLTCANLNCNNVGESCIHIQNPQCLGLGNCCPTIPFCVPSSTTGISTSSTSTITV